MTVVIIALVCGTIYLICAICLLAAVCRSKFMKNHMTGTLLVNLAVVGLVIFVTDILIELEAEVLAESNIKGRVTCHMIEVLSTVTICEFTLILLLLALDRILVTLDKVPYDNKKALSWFLCYPGSSPSF